MDRGINQAKEQTSLMSLYPFASSLLGQVPENAIIVLAAFVLLVLAVTGLFVAFIYGNIWLQALRQVDARLIVRSQIMAKQAGLSNDPETGITTRRIEAHYLAGGNVANVIRAIIAAHRADIDLDFDRAAAIDLAGRDVLEAVQTSVYPKVIDCPDQTSKKNTLSAIAKNSRCARESRFAPT
jgi:uncharacterized protein YqfA (UPF0365 family)